MVKEFDIVKVTLSKRNDKKEFFDFKVRAFDVGDFFEKFLQYFDNYDDVTIHIGKYYIAGDKIDKSDYSDDDD